MLGTTALDYEVPQQSLHRAGIYELEPYSKTTEIVYEPVTDDNIYCTPCVPNTVRIYIFLLMYFE